MPEAKIAYETYGRLAPDGRNAVLIAHGYTSSHHAAGRNPANGNQPGWWDGLIGPGKAIDTDKLFVVSSNMLGSSFGSTNGASIDPATGKALWARISRRSPCATSSRRRRPCSMSSASSTSSPSPARPMAVIRRSNGPSTTPTSWTASLRSSPRRSRRTPKRASLNSRHGSQTDPQWNGGRYYDTGGAKAVLTELRVEMLKRNGIEAALAARYPERDAREAEIRTQAPDWARRWDANSLVILRRGTIGFDTVKDFAKIKAKVLYVLCRTDRLLPAGDRAEVMHDLAAAGVDARYFEIDSELGHSASGPEHAKWSPVLCEFIAPLIAKAVEGGARHDPFILCRIAAGVHRRLGRCRRSRRGRGSVSSRSAIFACTTAR